MAYDLEEQERIDEIRHWWQKNRAWILTLAIVILAAVIGNYAYKEWKLSSADKAATMYSDLAKAVTANDAKKVSELATQIGTAYPRSFDASRAGLQAAKTAFDGSDFATAKKHLEWVIDNGYTQHKPIASVRLAMVLLDEKKFDDALKVLDAVKDTGFTAQVADVRGDVLLAANRPDEARNAYKAAIDALTERSQLKSTAQAKFDSLGGVMPAPTAPVASGISASPAPASSAPAATTKTVTVPASGAAPEGPAIAVQPASPAKTPAAPTAPVDGAKK